MSNIEARLKLDYDAAMSVIAALSSSLSKAERRLDQLEQIVAGLVNHKVIHKTTEH